VSSPGREKRETNAPRVIGRQEKKTRRRRGSYRKKKEERRSRQSLSSLNTKKRGDSAPAPDGAEARLEKEG